MNRTTLVRLALMSTLALAAAPLARADDPAGCAGWIYPSVSPPQPGCDDAVTLEATQWLTDTCWTAEAPVFSAQPPDFNVETASIDLWPQYGCLTVIIEIPFAWQVGPLEAGPYSWSLSHHWSSDRHGDGTCEARLDFDVTCCPELPAEVPSLVVDKDAGETRLWLTWDNVADADDYAVFGADAADGPFTRRLATGTDGAAGAGIPIDDATEFLLVGARNSCGVGPRH